MGLFSILKSGTPATATQPKNNIDTWIELGCTESEFRSHFAGHEIKIDERKISEDFTVGEETREYFRKREALYPKKLNVIAVHLWSHPGIIFAEFTADGILGCISWNETNWDLRGNAGIVDVPMTMDTVNKIVNEMNAKYGTTSKETEGHDYIWKWAKDNITMRLEVTWFTEGDEDNSTTLTEEYLIGEE